MRSSLFVAVLLAASAFGALAQGGGGTAPDASFTDAQREGLRLFSQSCGVCHTDLHVMKGEVAFPTPCVLGHEIAGVVEAVGPGVEGFRGGERVACAFIMPCGHCRWCARGGHRC